MGACFELLGSSIRRRLEFDLRIGLDVSKPCRVRRRATLRRHDDAVLAIAATDQWSGDELAALGAFRGHEHDMVAPHPDSKSLLGMKLFNRLLVPGSSSHRLKSTVDPLGIFFRDGYLQQGPARDAPDGAGGATNRDSHCPEGGRDRLSGRTAPLPPLPVAARPLYGRRRQRAWDRHFPVALDHLLLPRPRAR